MILYMLALHGNYNNRRAMLTSHNEHIDNLIGLTVFKQSIDYAFAIFESKHERCMNMMSI
jgi:hypothetical protein